MRTIIEPEGSDDFFSPEFLRFASAAVAVFSALWAVFGVWIVAAHGGCF